MNCLVFGLVKHNNPEYYKSCRNYDRISISSFFYTFSDIPYFYFYIGLRYKFQWIDGTSLSSSWTNWYQGVPPDNNFLRCITMEMNANSREF